MAQTTPKDIAWRHLWLSLRNGLALLLPVALVGVLIYFAFEVQGQAPEMASPPPPPGETSGSWVSLGGVVVAFSAGTVWFGALFVGVPAALLGALRIWPMRWLLRMCLAEPTNPNMGLGLAATLLLFESPLLVAALFGASNKSIGFCTLVSLPFLLGSLWATWQLLRAEQLEEAE